MSPTTVFYDNFDFPKPFHYRYLFFSQFSLFFSTVKTRIYLGHLKISFFPWFSMLKIRFLFSKGFCHVNLGVLNMRAFTVLGCSIFWKHECGCFSVSSRMLWCHSFRRRYLIVFQTTPKTSFLRCDYTRKNKQFGKILWGHPCWTWVFGLFCHLWCPSHQITLLWFFFFRERR